MLSFIVFVIALILSPLCCYMCCVFVCFLLVCQYLLWYFCNSCTVYRCHDLLYVAYFQSSDKCVCLVVCIQWRNYKFLTPGKNVLHGPSPQTWSRHMWALPHSSCVTAVVGWNISSSQTDLPSHTWFLLNHFDRQVSVHFFANLPCQVGYLWM